METANFTLEFWNFMIFCQIEILTTAIFQKPIMEDSTVFEGLIMAIWGLVKIECTDNIFV